MNAALRKISFNWEMESVSEPYFNYGDDGLEISFMVYSGDEARENEINAYLSSHDMENESEMPDDIYNNAGYGTVYFSFAGVDSLYFSSVENYLKTTENKESVSIGVYEEINSENEVIGYVFTGHDLFLSVKTRCIYIEQVKKQ